MFVTPLPILPAKTDSAARPLELIPRPQWASWWDRQTPAIQHWLTGQLLKQDKEPASGKLLTLPEADGSPRYAVIVKPQSAIWALGDLPYKLPEGDYRLQAEDFSADEQEALALGWLLGSYRFDRYKRSEREPARLALPSSASRDRLEAVAEGIYFARDLINMPTNDMLPSHLEGAARVVAKEGKAKLRCIAGDALLKQNYPLIHAVGRASTDAPRLIELTWGKKNHPKVTIVGKGVCFDSGGLDIKPASAMLLMKKDMGGAAIALGLALAVMRLELPIRLRLFIPAVENAISGNAYRPGDVYDSRKGSTVEISNTDAEGRLILCDPLYEADSENPDLLIDLATLTGAARVALGAEIPALFSNNDMLAREVTDLSFTEQDPLWHLPLWSAYREKLDSKIADINHSSDSPYGGAITAALYLQHFVERCPNWLHIDVMAWNTRAQPGRPAGGEAMGLRTLLRLIERRYGHE